MLDVRIEIFCDTPQEKLNGIIVENRLKTMRKISDFLKEFYLENRPKDNFSRFFNEKLRFLARISKRSMLHLLIFLMKTG